MKLIATLLLCTHSLFSSGPNYFVKAIHPDSIEICIMQKNACLSHKEWKKSGLRNFVNLSFFDRSNVIGSLILDSVQYGLHREGWPLFTVFPTVGECFFPKMGSVTFSGSNALVRKGELCELPKTKFTRRKCPRTCIGTNNDGMVIVYVSKSCDLFEAAKRMKEYGCVFAVNVDGGSSTMFVQNGMTIWSTKRRVPVVLSWR